MRCASSYVARIPVARKPIKKYLGLIKFGDFSLEKKGLYDCGKQEEKNQTNY